MQNPRQLYGLGSLVKSITKGVKTGIKGITSTVKENPLLALAALNFAPMLPMFGGGAPFIGMGSLTGRAGTIPGINSLFSGGVKKAGGSSLGGKLGGKLASFGIGSAIAALMSTGMSEEQAQTLSRDPSAVKQYLRQYYSNLNQKAGSQEVDNFVNTNTAEYRANGGRIGYAYGSSDIVDQASGIMGLPQRTNSKGVKELDLRETGGFIPPVGVKEKADDIPAMLSNNEFVMTADAVRGMGEGDVNKGAQRLYDQMKMLENGGRV